MEIVVSVARLEGRQNCIVKLVPLGVIDLVVFINVHLGEKVFDFCVSQVLVEEEFSDLSEVVGSVLGVFGQGRGEVLLFFRLREGLDWVSPMLAMMLFFMSLLCTARCKENSERV